MIQEELERLGTWTGNQMIHPGVTQANLASGAKEEIQMKETNMEHSHLEGGWGATSGDKRGSKQELVVVESLLCAHYYDLLLSMLISF